MRMTYFNNAFVTKHRYSSSLNIIYKWKLFFLLFICIFYFSFSRKEIFQANEVVKFNKPVEWSEP